jgi:hypothetical protein
VRLQEQEFPFWVEDQNPDRRLRKSLFAHGFIVSGIWMLESEKMISIRLILVCLRCIRNNQAVVHTQSPERKHLYIV